MSARKEEKAQRMGFLFCGEVGMNSFGTQIIFCFTVRSFTEWRPSFFQNISKMLIHHEPLTSRSLDI